MNILLQSQGYGYQMLPARVLASYPKLQVEREPAPYLGTQSDQAKSYGEL